MFMIKVKGNINKMLKIIERSKAVRIFLYFAICCGVITQLIYELPDILKVINHG